MLTTLRIKNLALVSDLTVGLEPGYNVITGETGAGKSILIGALNLVLGERADRTLIRGGSDGCAVEAVFDVKGLEIGLGEFLEQHGLEPCEDNQLVVRRTLAATGANRQFINGSPTTTSVLAQVGEWLVDIHGPHEHQSLLKPAKQLDLLDAFGQLGTERAAFSGLVRRRAGLIAEKTTLIVDERTYAQQLDLLRFQVNEITAARLQPEEELTVEQDHRRASNAARLLELIRTALDLLSENDSSLIALAGSVGRTLQDMRRVDPAAEPLLSIHGQAIAALADLQAELSRYAEKAELDPERLAALEERLNLIQTLKRKYGASLVEVIAFGEEAQRKLTNLEERDEHLARLNAELERVERELSSAGQALTARRRKLIPVLSKAVSQQLAGLGFKQSRFDITLATQSMDSAASPEVKEDPRLPHVGFDSIEFEFAPNPGEPSRPLRAIASSGELARVMLAIKTVLAEVDQVPVLVFDEVDANVGGETANAVGEKMRQIARKRQVLCITHLPQVAAPASAHYVAAKQTRSGRTVSQITRLEAPERVTELARMLGGQTDAARKHAAALLKES